MMNRGIFAMASRNVWRGKRRYGFLVGGLALGAGILILLNSLFSAMIFNTEKKASVYYGGDASLIGFFPISTDLVHFTHGRAGIEKREFLKESVRKVLGEDVLVAFRRVHRPGNLLVVNEDKSSLRQRLIIGTDFSAEAGLLSRLGLDAKTIAALQGSKSILVSRVVAQKLNLEPGSKVTILTDTVTGQKNTDSMTVGGIFDDASVFGATSIYMDRESLNHLINDPVDAADEMTLYAPDRRIPDARLDDLQKAFSEQLQMFPRLLEKPEGWQERLLQSERWDKAKFLLIGLSAHLSQVHDRIVALELVSLLLVLILMIIVSLGIFNTFRLLVYERYKEIGTLRALGMKRRTVQSIFLIESLIMSAAGFVLGIVISSGLMEIAAHLDYSSLKGFEIFLENGSLRGRIEVANLFFAFCILCAAGVAGAWFPSLNASRIQPAQALRKE